MVFSMMKLKGKELLLIDKMRQITYFFLFMFFASCTSNTIFKKTERLNPKRHNESFITRNDDFYEC